jgi:hypothetical protein
MRIWTIAPKYLDTKGLVALWRETLLAQKCLDGKTKGYTKHPQLDRFKTSSAPLESIGNYLLHVAKEAQNRHYNFDKNKILFPKNTIQKISTNNKQLLYEWQHFLQKIEIRDPKRFEKLKLISAPESHPLFNIIEGPIEAWEKP